MHRSRWSSLKTVWKEINLHRRLQTETISKNIIVKSPGEKLNLPKNVLLQNFMAEELSKWDNRIALECIETNRSYTYLDIKIKPLRLAHFLRNSLKLDKKATIGVLLPNTPDFPIVVFGALRAGLSVSLINPNYGEDEVKRQLIISKSKALFALAEMGQQIKDIAKSLRIPIITLKLKENTPSLDGTINFYEIINSGNNLPEHVDDLGEIFPDDTLFVPFSSGTTGVSKGVELTHNNMVSNLEQANAKGFCNFTNSKDDVVPAFLPFFHIYGLMFVMLHILSHGAKLITFPKFTSESFIKCLRKHRPTFIPSVPPVIHLLMNNPQIKPDDFFSIRTILSGAAPFSGSDVDRFHRITKGKVNLIQAYGMTESSPLSIIQSIYLKGGVKQGGTGVMVPNTEGRFVPIDEPNSQIGLGPHQPGELYIRGPQVMKGYLNNPEATRETITEDGWLRTGDIGYHDEDGHIFITDRAKELIKVNAFQVAPAELEALIRNHPSVDDVAVVGVPHPTLGEAPKAFVVPKQDTRLKPEEIQDFVASKVAKFKRLTGGVEFLNSIPRNPSGKILRKVLKTL